MIYDYKVPYVSMGKFFVQIHKNSVLRTLILLLFVLMAIYMPKTTLSKTGSNCSLQFVSVPSSRIVSSGGEVTYNYSLKNVGRSTCTGTSVSIYYAGNEEYVRSDLVPRASDYYWFMGNLAKRETVSFSVTIKNVPNENNEMYGEACASADYAEDACVKEAVTVSDQQSSTPPPTTTVISPVTVVETTIIPVSSQTDSLTSVQAWIYPGAPACNSTNEYSDGRQIDVLKPEYYTIQSNGTLRLRTVTSDGCNGYSESNVADVKAHSKSQFVTVSGSYTNMHLLLSSIDLQNTAIKTLTDFAVSSGFSGVEIDWEGFGKWTATDYSNYKKFVTALQSSLRSKGKLLMIDAPAISDSKYQSYFLFKYEDFTNVDYIAIMAYDYQYDFGVGQSVAPEFWLKNVINWAKARLPLEKIIIGIPTYGYHGILGSYNITIDTYAQSTTYPGFSTRKLNADGEEVWMSGSTYYSVQPVSVLNRRKALIESMGIKNISVWHLGGNQWFSQN